MISPNPHYQDYSKTYTFICIHMGGFIVFFGKNGSRVSCNINKVSIELLFSSFSMKSVLSLFWKAMAEISKEVLAKLKKMLLEIVQNKTNLI